MDTRVYLDLRAYKPESKKGAPVKLAFTVAHRTTLIPLEVRVRPEDWDEIKGKVVNLPNRKLLNSQISIMRNRVETILMGICCGKDFPTMTSTQVRQKIMSELNPQQEAEPQTDETLFVARLIKFAEEHSSSTRAMYMHTLSRLRAYDDACKVNLDSLHFEDITKEWLTSFENFLARTACKNARNIHLRNIRAVFNNAIDDEVTTAYPFRRFKIRPVPTRKRSLSVDQLRTLFGYEAENFAIEYIDMFKLMFMLIGINAADLFNLKDLKDGRVEYYRAKTHKLYSIKVEPEAMAIIERYKGKDWLLNVMDSNKDYRYYLKHFNRGLKTIGELTRSGLGGKKTRRPLFPELSTYWARHTWATIAASLDIPKETIAHALGHGNNTVTDIYIDFDQKKVDEANRRVIDWVLYGKK